MTRTLVIVACAAVIGSAAISARQVDQRPASIQLEAAIKKEVVDGDATAALELYGKLAQSADKAVAAKAQQHMARLAALTGAGGQSVNTRLAFSGLDERVLGPISRDGRYLASELYGRRLYLHDLFTGGELEVSKVSGPTETMRSPVISPDGKRIAYELYSGQPGSRLMVIDAKGANSRELAAAGPGEGVTLCDWTPDGTQILVWKAPMRIGPSPEAWRRLTRYQFINTTTGAVVRTLEIGGGPCGRVSPDGRYFTAVTINPSGDPNLVVRSVDGKEIESLDETGNADEDSIWSQDGMRVLFTRNHGDAPWNRSGNDLWAVRVVNGKKAGEPELVKKNVGKLLGVSKAGDYYYKASTMTADLYAVDLDPSSGTPVSRPKQLTTQFNNWGASWSPDGQSLAYFSNRGDTRALVIRAATGGKERVLTVTGLPGNAVPRDRPIWMPDGSLLVRLGDTADLYTVDTQSGAAKRLMTLQEPRLNVGAYHSRLQLSPDAKSIFYLSGLDRGLRSIVRRSLDGGTTETVYKSPGTFLSGPALSPDGTMLAFAASVGSIPDDDVLMVMVMPVTGGQPREVCRVNDHVQDPIWSKDGQRLIFTTYNNPPRKGGQADVWTVPVAGGQPKPLNLGLHWVFFPTLSPDGRHLVVRDENYNNEVWVIRNLFGK